MFNFRKSKISEEAKLEKLISALTTIKQDAPCDLVKVRLGRLVNGLEGDLKYLSVRKNKK